MQFKIIAYKLSSSETSWKLIPIQAESVTYSESDSSVRQGNLIEVNCTAYVPGITMARDSEFQKLSALHGMFLFVTVAGDKYYVGTSGCKALFSYEKLDAGKPGSRSGYNIKIYLKSAPDQLFKSFASEGDGGNIAFTE